jgi:hypothetical protein
VKEQDLPFSLHGLALEAEQLSLSFHHKLHHNQTPWGPLPKLSSAAPQSSKAEIQKTSRANKNNITKKSNPNGH